jgi:mannose/cellobiose epimerase-like protein (N-acyl-D-glucosamine 2-epimerase family)
MIPNTTAVDLPWFRSHLLDDILPRWRKASVTASGLFLPHLDREWRRTGDVTGTLVSQGRLLYNFSVGYRLTGDRAYLDAVVTGARFLHDKFWDFEVGGFAYRCDWGGNVVDDTRDAYGHAFATFGFAHTVRTTGNLLHAATLTLALSCLLDFMCPETGGMMPKITRDREPLPEEQRPTNTQNPMMHSFEACLAASDYEPKVAGKLGAWIAERLFARAARPLTHGLPELYTEDWQPLPTDRGGRIDLGHQFEWAYLLSRAVGLDYPKQYLDWANELLDYGMRVGYDPAEGGIFANASLEGEVTDRAKGWWQQCEATRALMHFAIEYDRDDLWEPLAKTIAYFKANLIDPEFGGWYYGPGHRNKGSEWKVDYHVVAMCEEAIRLAEVAGEDT